MERLATEFPFTTLGRMVCCLMGSRFRDHPPLQRLFMGSHQLLEPTSLHMDLQAQHMDLQAQHMDLQAQHMDPVAQHTDPQAQHMDRLP